LHQLRQPTWTYQCWTESVGPHVTVLVYSFKDSHRCHITNTRLINNTSNKHDRRPLILHSIKTLTRKVAYLFNAYYHVNRVPEGKWRSCSSCLAISRNCHVVFIHSREIGSEIMRCPSMRADDYLTNLMYLFKWRRAWQKLVTMNYIRHPKFQVRWGL
jgi:hypothetical protein